MILFTNELKVFNIEKTGRLTSYVRVPLSESYSLTHLGTVPSNGIAFLGRRKHYVFLEETKDYKPSLRRRNTSPTASSFLKSSGGSLDIPPLMTVPNSYHQPTFLPSPLPHHGLQRL